MHENEVLTDETLVRRLLQEQFPDLANLPVQIVDSYGTDHDIYRLGDELVVRLPRVDWATDQAAKESVWLPRLAPQVPLAVPVPLAMGRPSQGYPYQWSIYQWLPGFPAHDNIADLETAARELADFIRSLRRIDTTDAPKRATGARGAPLDELDYQVRRSIRQLGERIDGAGAIGIWEEALRASRHHGDQTWVHGDLLPGNLLVVDGKLSAVIDFGGLNVGDPACDLQPAWNLFIGRSRTRFRTELEVDDDSWQRGRGWVVFQTVSALAYYWETNAGITRQASHALREVLAD